MVFTNLTAIFRRRRSSANTSELIPPSPEPTKSEEQPPNDSLCLLDLPLEIRRIIWSYCFPRPVLTTSAIPPPRPRSRYERKAQNMMHPHEIWNNKMELVEGTVPVGKEYLNLFLVNRQVSHEGRDVFWGKAVLVLWKHELMYKGLDFQPCVWRNIKLVAINESLCKFVFVFMSLRGQMEAAGWFACRSRMVFTNWSQ